MTPIFDRKMQHVGWVEGQNVFDTQIQWVAFIDHDHLYHASTMVWLGPWNNGALLDRNGLVVGWTPEQSPRARRGLPPGRMPMRPPIPFRPKRPIAPRRPLFPQTPYEEWSSLDWAEWLALGLPDPEPAPEPARDVEGDATGAPAPDQAD